MLYLGKANIKNRVAYTKKAAKIRVYPMVKRFLTLGHGGA